MRRRILALVIAMTCATLLALLIPASFVLHSARRGESQAVLLNEAFEYAHQYDSTNTVGTMAEHQIAVFGPDGRIVEGDGPPLAGKATVGALAGIPTVVREGDRMVAAVPLAGGRAMRVAETSHESDLDAAETLAKLSGLALATITVAAIIAFQFARRMNRPLVELAASARRLGGGDFTARSSPSGLSEIDDVSAALNATAERLSQLIARERRLTTETTHQLRTPLAGMRIAIEAERDEPQASPTPATSTLLDDLLLAIDRMDHAITDLMTLSRTADRDGKVVSVVDLVRRAVERWEHPYRVAGRALTTEIAAGIVPADILTSARAAAIDTVLDVLLDNALVHGTGRVGVRLEFVLVAPVIWIADEGTFDVDDPAEQSYDVAEARSQHGYGMRIAHALADAEGARVHLAKREPTTFELILPAPGE